MGLDWIWRHWTFAGCDVQKCGVLLFELFRVRCSELAYSSKPVSFDLVRK